MAKQKTAHYLENVGLLQSSHYEWTQDFRQDKFLDTLWQNKTSQALALQNLGYKIVMWDILSADFDTETTKENV
jgi:hypothetical protein